MLFIAVDSVTRKTRIVECQPLDKSACSLCIFSPICKRKRINPAEKLFLSEITAEKLPRNFWN